MGIIRAEQLAKMNMVYKRHSFEYFLETTCELGFKKIELYCNLPHFSDVYESTFRVKEIKRAIDASGLEIVCFTPEQAFSAYNQCAKDAISRKNSLEYYKRYMDAAAEIGAPMFLTGLGGGFYDEPIEECWERGFELGEDLLRVAESADMKIAWEIGCSYVTPLLNGIESCHKVMERLDSPYSGLAIDTCPVIYDGNTLQEYFEHFGEKMFHIHLNDGEPDNFLVWGDGTQPLDQHLQDLARNNYTGAMTLEVCDSRYFATPHESLKRGLEVLHKHLPFEAEVVKR